MMALAIRQAWRGGAAIYLVGAGTSAGEPVPAPWQGVATLAEVPLAAAQRPVLIASAASTPKELLEAAAGLGVPLACLHDGANGRGAALLAREQGAVSLEEALETGRIRGIVAVEADIPPALLAQVPFVATLDWRPTPAVAAARVFLPTTSWLEMDGTCINYEGRAQRFARVMDPGLPLRQLDQEGNPAEPSPAPPHPSHEHRLLPPGAEPQPAWQLLAEILRRLGDEESTDPLSGPWERLRQLDPEGEGLLLE
jgi:NADH-quinone oxidoreductase subunit G